MRPPPTLTRRAGVLAWLCICAAAQAQTAAVPLTLMHDPVQAPLTSDPGAPADGPALTWSGFGTLGWAQSNRAWGYQRFIDRNGGVERDSVFGAQLDAQLAPEWSATLQARLAPSAHADNAWDLRTSWAFVAWRPDNDWLLRAGKLRVPMFLRSEHLDVGQTYDEARLPAEVYSLAPTTDFTGVHVSRSWDLASGELSLDAYRGSATMSKRTWMRAGLPPQVPAGDSYTDARTTAQGVVATWVAPSGKARLGLHHTRTTRANGEQLVVRPTWVQLGPGFGYWQTSNELPGPGVKTVPAINNYLIVLGGDHHWGAGWRTSGEAVRVLQQDTELGVEAWGGYLTLSREWGRITPYLSYALLRSSSKSRQWAETLEATTVPAMVPGAAMLDATMRIRAETLPVYDQQSWALGSAYTLNAHGKLKAEWLHTRATLSSMFDLGSGQKIVQPRSVDVISLSYSFVF